MLNIFKTDLSSGAFKQINEFESGAWVDLVSPTDEELNRVTEALDIPLAFLRGPLDAEEKSRIDIEDDLTHVIVDIPIIERVGGERAYDTIPLGMLLHPHYFITTCLQPNPILGEFERGAVRSFATFKKTRFLLQILLQVSCSRICSRKRVFLKVAKLRTAPRSNSPRMGFGCRQVVMK